jgi:hypothetical protein
MEKVVTRILLGERCFLGSWRTVAVAESLGAIGPNRNFGEAVLTQYLSDAITSGRGLVQDYVGDHPNRAMAILPPAPCWQC